MNDKKTLVMLILVSLFMFGLAGYSLYGTNTLNELAQPITSYVLIPAAILIALRALLKATRKTARVEPAEASVDHTDSQTAEDEWESYDRAIIYYGDPVKATRNGYILTGLTGRRFED